jgi:imidazole glycerol-phosphate synthase subunit HisF
MVKKRLIPCLDVAGGRVVKGIRFQDLRDVGDPVELAERYSALGADEIVFLDVTATIEDRRPPVELVERAAASLEVPFTVGGGIAELEDARALLRAGADKVAVNRAALERPELLTELADEFGAQAVVCAIDAKGGEVFTHGARRARGVSAVKWAVKAARFGAGEILLTSIDADGTREGYDLVLTQAVADAVPVPVIASGGAGNAGHLSDAFDAGADAALVASIVHERPELLPALKIALKERGWPIRI